MREPAAENATENPATLALAGERSAPFDHRRHLSSLDGLRGIAILAVFLFHDYPRAPHDPISLLAGGGWLGVDLFFTLSGFLITGILFDTVQQPRFFRNFYMRRSLRLVPVYVVMIAVVLIVAHFVGEHPNVWAIPFFLYGSNITGNLGHRPGVGDYLELSHLWSLALEEQFYLLWAPAVFLLRTRSRILWACALGSGFAIIARFVLASHPLAYFAPYNQLPTRLDALLAGGALALWIRREHGSRGRAGTLAKPALYAALGAGTAALLFCVATAHTSYWSSLQMVRLGYLAAAVVSAALIGLAIVPESAVARVGNVGVLRVFGRYSYGLYLWHRLPARFVNRFFACTSRLGPSPMLARVVTFLLVLAGALAVAMISYHTIELYFLRLKKYFAYTDEKRAHHLQADQDTTLSVA